MALDVVVTGRFSRVVHDVQDDEVLVQSLRQLRRAGHDVIGHRGEVHRDQNGPASALLRHETRLTRCGGEPGSSARTPGTGFPDPDQVPTAPDMLRSNDDNVTDR